MTKKISNEVFNKIWDDINENLFLRKDREESIETLRQIRDLIFVSVIRKELNYLQVWQFAWLLEQRNWI
jgi:hypothetical protein